MSDRPQLTDGKDKPETFKIGDGNTKLVDTAEDHYPIAGGRIKEGSFVHFKNGKWYTTKPNEQT